MMPRRRKRANLIRAATAACCIIGAWAGPASAQTAEPAPGLRESATIPIQELVRIEGEGRSMLRAMGIVTGLKGSGDSGSELVLARPLAKLYESNLNPLPDLADLAKGKSAAVVFLWASISEEGARKGDLVDVYVKVAHSATSLAGGMLEITPMLGPLPGDDFYGFAAGTIQVESAGHPTVGVIKDGLQLTKDIRMAPLGAAFSLIVRPHYRGWSTTRMLANELNDLASGGEEEAAAAPIARALDAMTVRIEVPEHERADPANFIAGVLSRRISPSLLDLPPQVIVNRRTGNIIATGDVEISSVAVAHKDLVVTTTVPPPAPTAANPSVTRDKWVTLHTASRASERARMSDLLAAFKQLDVPIDAQIDILSQMHRAGRLHARLIVE